MISGVRGDVVPPDRPPILFRQYAPFHGNKFAKGHRPEPLQGASGAGYMAFVHPGFAGPPAPAHPSAA